MKIFEVILSKSYKVKIQAEDTDSAKEFSEFFTNDISDISTTKDREKYNFVIENIDCKLNECYEIREVYENN
jgi:hypothetical protein